MKDIVLEVIEVNKKFGNKNVLSNVSFNVDEGDIFGFIGLNGVGKTTLIKIVIDLLDQDNGEVKIYNKSRIFPKSRENIFYLPEKFNPPKNLTGLEFLEFSNSFYDKKVDQEYLKLLCENLGLELNYLKNKLSTYSKGMGQKIGLIAVFLSEAKFVILDEPMSGLDPKSRIALKKELINYQNKGHTVFFSSHILSDIEEICNKILILNEAAVKYYGTPKELILKNNCKNLEESFLKEIEVI